MKPKILFYGEFQSTAINGVSVANEINISMLQKSFSIDVIEEHVDFQQHSKISVLKAYKNLVSLWLILNKSFSCNYSYFYSVFSLSTFGGLKTLFAIICFRIFNSGEVVLHIHRGDFFSRFYKGFVNRKIAWLIFRITHKVIVLSERSKTDIERAFNNSCVVLNNTVSFEYNVDYTKKQNVKFLYISNYLIEKGIIDLLEAFSKLCLIYPNISLQTYGTFSDQHLKEIILSFNSSNIEIFETISGIEKFEKIAKADCIILPSWNEGQPIIILEAMSVGVPVIATNVGLIPDLLGSNYPYLANPKDPKSLVETVTKFINAKNNHDISNVLKNQYFEKYCKRKHEEDLLKIFTPK